MRVIRSDVMGMCFGVRDALAILDKIDDARSVTIHGELVHNEIVLHQLGARGFHQTGERGRGAIPDAETVLITAHGVSNAERSRLEAAGKTLIDTTCPLVARAHRAATALRDQGYHVVVIGKPGHVEVRGLVGDLDRYDVVSSPEDAHRIDASRIGIVCQTTMPPPKARAIREAIEAANPDAEVRFVDTVCRPTKEHQRALDRLIEQVDAVVVVGGKNSNNTRELAETCRARGVPAFHVQRATDLDPSWFAGLEVVGLTAGTSTLDDTIDEVHERLIDLAEFRVGVASGRLALSGR
jgi:4-hydroxy-3-methylbut-2-en-1-yl diphosphate reductase